MALIAHQMRLDGNPCSCSSPVHSCPACNLFRSTAYMLLRMSRKFRQWVDQYQDQAWTLARYLLKDPAEAEDAVQEAFVKLWNHQQRVDPERIRPWLMKVTRNLCLDRLRRRRPTQEWQEWQKADESPGPMQGAEQRELGEWLKHSINGLTEPYRSLVVLRDVHQHSYEEVANVLELSLPQVKVYLHRARKQLREQLAEVRP
jgi:RNA polymerase sigma-70 factor (ECF subfamily)